MPPAPESSTAPEDGLEEKLGVVDPKDGGVNYCRLAGTVENIDLNGPEAQAVLRKIDLFLLPFLMVTYLIQVQLAPSLVTTRTKLACDLAHAQNSS